MIIDSRFVNTTIRKANQLNYVIEDVEFVLNLAMDEMGRGVGPGGPRGPGFPLESRIHRVKFLKIGKISSFLLLSTVQYYNEKMKYKTVNRVNKLYALLSVTYRLVVDSRLVNTTIRNANHIGKLGEKNPNS